MSNTTLSNSKIILLVMFICGALMTSLFVFHLTHKQTPTIIEDGNSTVFPLARDIKPFELVATNEEKFTQKNFLGHWSLVFFGFTHCASICPASLDMLGKAYNELHTAYPNLQVVLISLDPWRDNLTALAKFTHTFHPAFIGATGKIQEIRKLQSQLGVFSSEEDKQNDNYQIQHSPSILLINPQGKWAAIFKFGMTPSEFTHAFKESMRYV